MRKLKEKWIKLPLKHKIIIIIGILVLGIIGNEIEEVENSITSNSTTIEMVADTEITAKELTIAETESIIIPDEWNEAWTDLETQFSRTLTVLSRQSYINYLTTGQFSQSKNNNSRYSQEAIAFAIEQLDQEVNWYEEAYTRYFQLVKAFGYNEGLLNAHTNEGFTENEIDYAIDKIIQEVDWNEIAKIRVLTYLEDLGENLDDTELMELLQADGFTQKEAEYGIAFADRSLVYIRWETIEL